ncbi:bifunctional diguanylate cyclase/phosphodiesterase [Xaviernesmea oryzae]|nr:EAL domain-containing protein [Xaviernesmea oryzae]
MLAVAGLMALLSADVISTMRNAADEIDAKRSVNAVNAAILSVKTRLGATLRDNAIWDDAYAGVNTENSDSWILENWGSVSVNYPLYDGVAVLDQEGQQVGAYLKGNPVQAITLFGPDLLVQSRAAALNPDANPIVNFYPSAEGVTMIATLAIQPDNYKAGPASTKTLSFFKMLDSRFIKAVAEDFQVEGLVLRPERAGGELNLALHDLRAKPIGYLNWPPKRPGTAVYTRIQPQLVAILSLFALFFVVVVTSARLEIRKIRGFAEKADHDATHDDLTGLLNRSGLSRAIAELPEGPAVLHLIDLDGFKSVNDSWGHAVGDELLRLVGAKLKVVRPDVVVTARLGGDEFAIVQLGKRDPAALGIALIKEISRPLPVEGRTVEIGASIGFAQIVQGIPALEIVRRADMALYRAKEDGRGRVVAFDDELDIERQETKAAEDRLKQALAQGDITVVYQPLVSARDGRLTGVEALARWPAAPDGIGPEIFIPLAEKSGLIDSLFFTVLCQAVEGVKVWPDLELSVNISPIQLCNPEFGKRVAAVIADEAFAADRLILEVTEGVLIAQPEQARRAIDGLRAIGVRFAMDDFGAGHASIGMLRHFGFEKVKIDRSVVALQDPVLLKAIIELAAALQIPVTAEGIETEEQARLAREAGCEQLQGYLVGAPLSLDELIALKDGVQRRTGTSRH